MTINLCPAAASISTDVYILPNPANSSPVSELIVAQYNLTFSIRITSDIRTLHIGNTEFCDISGILYVPQIQPHKHPCHCHIPWNATRLDIPNLQLDFIGYAPWISKECSKTYLDAALNDQQKTVAMVFYTVTNDNASVAMPMAQDPMFNIPFSKYPFSIYAINGKNGQPLMDKLAEYSGNMTEVWESPDLSVTYGVADYARIYMKITTARQGQVPGLWLFILAIMGLLLFIILLTSLIMHYIQYRRRVNLGRRVANGEVDLEAMGIKRLNVPREVLNKFPLRTYNGPTRTTRSSTSSMTHCDKQVDAATGNNMTRSQDSSRCSSSRLNTSLPINSPSHTTCPPHAVPSAAMLSQPSVTAPNAPDSNSDDTHSNIYSQPNCAVCLDEFESGTTIVRELPCLHIFHPECIDPHLLCNSSLCPLCKASTLPKGYIPLLITNATVRRERDMRRMREHLAPEDDQPSSRSDAFARRLRMLLVASRRRERSPDTGVAEAPRALGTVEASTGSEPRGTRDVGSERRRRFSAAVLAPTQEEEDDEWRQLSIWSRFAKYVFPV